MTPGIIEYTALRLVRRFAVTDRFLLRFGAFLPYYRSNTNQVDAGPVIDLYGRFRDVLGLKAPGDRVILEVGCGATNSVGYALAQSDWPGPKGRIILFEPFVPLDERADARMREAVPNEARDRVRRIDSLDRLERGSVDVVLSHSVLEHVREPDALLRDLDRVLAPGGVMLHVVDYRDHFFKYPYHFLLFSKRAWDRWLDPGDLPRWRLTDHLRQFRARRFEVEVLESMTMPDAFRPVAARLSPEFDARDPGVAVAQAVLAVRRKR